MYIWVKPRPHTHTKCGLRFPPQYHISQNLNILWVQKRNPNMLPFSLKESRQSNPLQVPQRGLYGETYPLTGHFYFSLNIFLFIFPSESPVRAPSMFPNRVPMGSDITSPEPVVYFSFIYSCMHVCPSPRKRALLTYVITTNVTRRGGGGNNKPKNSRDI